MKKLVFAISILVSHLITAQDYAEIGKRPTTSEVFTYSYSEFGLNATPLVLQLMPFQSVDSRSGPFGFVYKHFGGEHGVKIALGGNINLNSDNSYLNLSLGYEHKKDVGEHWSWYQSYDFLLSGGSLNIPSEPRNDDTSIVGVGFGIGGEYRITPHVAVGTETLFIVGMVDGSFGDSGFAFRTVAPIAIYLRFRKF